MKNNTVIGVLAYNEELHIREVISELSSLNVQIFVIDDKSNDDTLKILNELKDEFNLIVIENEKNKAKEELREQMSEIIIDTTQKILGDEISKEKHEEILKKAAEEL